jgi:uncharacterized protein YjbI with pentapeptide repeats
MARNKAFAAAALVVGLLLVVFVVVSDYPPGESGMSGTMASPDKKIAGVEKADRSRTEQITDADVQLDDASFQILMQNNDFVAIVSSGSLALSALERVTDGLGRETLDKATQDGDFFRAASEFERQGVAEDFGRELERSGFERGSTDFDRMADELGKAAFERALEKAGLDRADMEKAGLDRESLEKAGLEKVDLDRAEFERGLERAGLDRSDLERAGFDREGLERAVSDMEKASSGFDRADMEKVSDLLKSDVGRSDLGKLASIDGLARAVDGFYRSDLGRGFGRADMERGDMERGDLGKSDLERADMEKADLGKSDLERADMEKADLGRADLGRADMEKADMEKADLGRADLGRADLGKSGFGKLDLGKMDWGRAADMAKTELDRGGNN